MKMWLVDALGKLRLESRIRMALTTPGEAHGEKKGTALGNVVMEVSNSVCDRLVYEGRVYIEWNAFKVKVYENVLRCYSCYEYEQRM
ncbi:hypothetical protein ALC57_17847 [Trachymyrmex cornetzi]|uniref:Uncharacterized protein n=1 Tax=Trachymyrmex cornetzi TaxID=471704 RepID=A0A151IT25_9HYME|nr:hypothetical protein ALC57_17847 [Trachymyrmex cornetzi]